MAFSGEDFVAVFFGDVFFGDDFWVDSLPASFWGVFVEVDAAFFTRVFGGAVLPADLPRAFDLDTAAFIGAFFTSAFFTSAFLAGVFGAAFFLTGVCFVADDVNAVLFAAVLFAAVLFAAVLFAAVFFGGVFFAAFLEEDVLEAGALDLEDIRKVFPMGEIHPFDERRRVRCSGEEKEEGTLQKIYTFVKKPDVLFVREVFA